MDVPELVVIALLVLVPIMYYWDLSLSRDKVCDKEAAADVCEDNTPSPPVNGLYLLWGVIALPYYTSFTPFTKPIT